MAFLVGYIATIFAANWAISTFGIIPVGFGLLALAGVYFAGLTFTLRDLTQERLEQFALDHEVHTHSHLWHGCLFN